MPSFNTYILMFFVSYVLSSFIYKNVLEDEISNLKKDNIHLGQKVGSLKRQSASLESFINSQNTQIRVLEVDYNNSIVELNEWKNKPIEVKYKTLYEYLPTKIIKVKTNDCNTTNIILDAIRNIDYNSI